jgi:hypothetical protein
MSNCYVNVIGGVGNQLFQIAAGYAYAEKYGKKLIINPYNWFAGQGTNPLVYKDTIFKNFEYGNYTTTDVTRIQEKRFNYDQLPYHSGDVSLHGYFQSLKYFEDVKKEFISLLNLPEISNDLKIDVGLHIRRGDYLKYPTIHHVCHTEYFEHFFEKFKDRDIKVFTDDPDHVANEFSNYKFDILKSDSDIKELACMTRCDTLVGSNSTFSWWAALIGNKTSYFPSKWFVNNSEATDIYHDKIIKHDV